MKTTKLIVAVSELWRDQQLTAARGCLLKGLEELAAKADVSGIMADLGTHEVEAGALYTEVEVDGCEARVLTRVDKVRLLQAVAEAGQDCDSVLLVYVGEIGYPGGQWLLSGGVVTPGEVLAALGNDGCKLAVAAPGPLEDWQAASKKRQGGLIVCGHDCLDQGASGYDVFADSICSSLSVTPHGIKRPEATSFLKAAKPSVCGFFERGCPAMPCLFLIDGFSMLFNVGSGHRPEVGGHLKYIAQLDAALLSHVGYNNILSLSEASRDPEGIRIGHLFLPAGVTATERVAVDGGSPFLVDLSSEVARLMAGCRDRGTGLSHMSAKGRGASKAVPLYHKIGCGSLELVPVLPLEEDLDPKKTAEDLRKGRTPPVSTTVLLLWRPFAAGAPVKRLLYVGARSHLRKGLPVAVAALLLAHDCLQAPKRPVAATAAPKKANGTAPPAETVKKHPRPATAPEVVKKAPAAAPLVPAPASARATTASKRPPTATTTAAAHKTKPDSARAAAAAPKKTTVYKTTPKKTTAVANGAKEEHKAAPAVRGDVDEQPAVAVGTVDSVITEHGEVHLCDDMPQELSAEYDGGEESSEGNVGGTSNLANLPMEGSIYDKENFDQPQPWSQPLGMPMPTKEVNGAPKKPTKSVTPLHVDCLCVPSDLDRDDLRCLFGLVRFESAFLQLEKSGDLSGVVEVLLEEYGTSGRAGTAAVATVIPSVDDEAAAAWVVEHADRLAASGVRVAPGLSRCSILIGGEQGDGACLGFRCDL